MHDVARVAGVSIKTVSNVINDYPHVRPGTRDRVNEAIEQLDYRPNLSARGLRSGRTGVIGLAVPSLRENYFAELADEVIRAAEKRGLGVMVEQTSGDRDTELRAVTGNRPRFLDGMLFSPVSLGQEDAEALSVDGPLVLLGERIFGGPTDHVTMHNTSSSQAAVEHLLEIGRRRIALVGADLQGGDEASSASLRLKGYLRALEQAGIELDPALVRPDVDAPMEPGRRRRCRAPHGEGAGGLRRRVRPQRHARPRRAARPPRRGSARARRRRRDRVRQHRREQVLRPIDVDRRHRPCRDRRDRRRSTHRAHQPRRANAASPRRSSRPSASCRGSRRVSRAPSRSRTDLQRRRRWRRFERIRMPRPAASVIPLHAQAPRGRSGVTFCGIDAHEATQRDPRTPGRPVRVSRRAGTTPARPPNVTPESGCRDPRHPSSLRSPTPTRGRGCRSDAP